MGLLLLVDLDGVVYRGADPVPGVAAVLADRAARGDDVVYVTNNSMHYRADYQTRLAAMGCPVTPDTRRVVRARDGALPARPRSRHPARAGPRRERARARAARRRLRRGDLGRGRDPDEPGADRRVRRRRQPRRGRRRARSEPDLCPAGGRLGQHPGGRPFHRHQPRPGLSDGAWPATGCRLDRHAARGRDRGRAGLDRQARPVPAGGRGACRRSRAGRGDHDRRRDRHGPRRGPCGRAPAAS